MLVLASGASLPLAFAPFHAWFWAPVPLGVLFLASAAGTVRQGAWRGLLFGIGFFGVGLAWIVESFKFNAVPYPLALIVTVALVVVLSGYLAIFGGVAAKPWRARAAEALLVGQSPGIAIFEEAARAALANAMPSGQNAFKIELARRLVARALSLASQGTPEDMPALPASPFSTIPGATNVA